MFLSKRKIVGLCLVALLAPAGVACGNDSPAVIEDETDEGTDQQPGTAETTRPEEG